jgi:predicted site-specific integrase-resolvase
MSVGKRRHFIKRRNKAQPVGEVYLNRLQVAAKLNVCLETLKRMEQRGQLHPIHLNSRVTRYRMSDIDKMMEAHEVAKSTIAG